MPTGSAATPGRVQAHMRAVARQQYDAVSVPPFTLFFHPSDPLPYLNYAIPDVPDAAARTLAAPLARLRAEFEARGRTPRFEFVEAVFPGLADALAAAGFAIEARPQLMLATPESRRTPPPVSGLGIDVLTAVSPLDAFREFLVVQRRAFGMGDAGAVSDEDARWLRNGLAGGRCFVGRLGGHAVSVSMVLDPQDGLTEVVGVCTLEPHRHRGLGGALTAAALTWAFSGPASAAFLSAADARAGRVYEAAGFAPFGNTVFAIARDAARAAALA
jgi:GNAT superfamily N-acetyltransferase